MGRGNERLGDPLTTMQPAKRFMSIFSHFIDISYAHVHGIDMRKAKPFIEAIVAGIPTGWVQTKLDQKYGVTQALIVAYKNVGIDLANLKYQVERELDSVPSSSHSLRCYFMPFVNFTH